MINDVFNLPLLASIPALILAGFAVYDVVRRADLNGVRTALWVVVVVAIPVLGTIVYLWARPVQDPSQAPSKGNERTDALIELISRHERGEVDDQTYAEEKRRVFQIGQRR